jgi:predicted alternative tryptophan synthase beta-subunit
MTKGELCYDFGDTAQMTTLLWMYTLGHATQIPSEHPRFVISTGTSLSFETYVTK